MKWLVLQLLAGEHLPLWAILLLAAREWKITIKGVITVKSIWHW